MTYERRSCSASLKVSLLPIGKLMGSRPQEIDNLRHYRSHLDVTSTNQVRVRRQLNSSTRISKETMATQAQVGATIALLLRAVAATTLLRTATVKTKLRRCKEKVWRLRMSRIRPGYSTQSKRLRPSTNRSDFVVHQL